MSYNNKKKLEAIQAKNKAKEMLFLMQERARQAASQFLPESLENDPTEDLPDSVLCPICCEIMDLPERMPITLFPCGHTICKSCFEKNKENYSNKCCECRAPITSQAVNQPLWDIIRKKAYLKEKSNSSDSKFTDEKASNITLLNIFQPLLEKAIQKTKAAKEELDIIQEEYDSANDEYNLYLEQITELTKSIEQSNSELKVLIDDESLQKSKLAELIPQYEELKLLAGVIE